MRGLRQAQAREEYRVRLLENAAVVVEAAENAADGAGVCGVVVRLQRGGDKGDDLRQFEQFARERHFTRMPQIAVVCGEAGRERSGAERFLCVSKNRGDACVAVLHLVDRIFVALFLEQLQIENNFCIDAAREQRESHGVFADFVDDVVDSDGVPGAFSHADFDAAAHDRNESIDQHLDRVGVQA